MDVPFCFVVKLRISIHIEVTAKSRGFLLFDTVNSRVKVHQTQNILVGKFCYRKSIIVPIPIEMTGFRQLNFMSHAICDCTFFRNICCMQSCTLQFIHELQTTYKYQHVLLLHRLLLELGHRLIRGSAIALTRQLFSFNYYCLTSVHLLSLCSSHISVKAVIMLRTVYVCLNAQRLLLSTQI